jgi:hypothetical protein
LGCALINFQFAPKIIAGIAESVGGDLGRDLARLVISTMTAAQYTLLVLAVFVGRRSAEHSDAEHELVLASHKAGLRNIVLGSVLLGLGMTITIVTFILAANVPGGSKFIVTYGLVVAGAIQMLRGLIQITK